MSRLASIIDIYDGNAWQKIADQLLHFKFGLEFQRVPDVHKGDWGIEGYTLEGYAFQCYAPERDYSAGDLYEYQRSKITRDIKKFKDNEAEIQKLIFPKKFSRWIFLTTVHNSKDLNLHAAKKSKEIRENCGHITPDFSVLIHSGEDFFFEEIGRYINQHVQKLSIKIPEINDDELNRHLKEGAGPYTTIQKKLDGAKITDADLEILSKEFMKDYLTGQSVLKNIESSSPELFEVIEKKKSSLERDILKKYRLTKNLTADEVNKDLQNLKVDLMAEVGKSLDSSTIDYVSRGVIADWLVRCPMEF